jgi:hypothetical protein
VFSFQYYASWNGLFIGGKCLHGLLYKGVTWLVHYKYPGSGDVVSSSLLNYSLHLIKCDVLKLTGTCIFPVNNRLAYSDRAEMLPSCTFKFGTINL